MQTREQQRSIYIPVLLIGIGMYWLLATLDVVKVNVFSVVMQFLPVLLIGLGLDLVFGRRRTWFGAILGVLVCLSLVGFGTWSNRISPVTASQPFAEPKNNLRSATIRLDSNAQNIQIGALPPKSDLIKGSLDNSDGVLDLRVNRDDQVATIQLDSQRNQWQWLNSATGTWQFDLTPDLPLSLDLRVNASDMNADLTRLQLSTLMLDMNAGKGSLDFPASGTITMEINAAALEVSVPKNSAVKIVADTSAANLEVPRSWTTTDNGETYTSPAWEGATQRLEITLDASAASVTVREK